MKNGMQINFYYSKVCFNVQAELQQATDCKTITVEIVINFMLNFVKTKIMLNGFVIRGQK